MTPSSTTSTRAERPDAALSLYHLLDPEVLANPYPLFHRLRREAPVQWDLYLHAWVVTRYSDVLEVLHTFSADRTPTPEQLTEMGLSQLNPIAQVMVQQMLFMDAPAHTRLRGLASKAFTPARVEALRAHIGDIVSNLLDQVQAKGSMDVIADFADPLPAIVTAELLGVPVSDHKRLKNWSANFAEMLGNFQHNPERAELMLRTVEEMTFYFRDAVREIKARPCEGLIHSLLTAEVDGDHLTEEEVIANAIVTMVGGQETTTNLIGNGVLTLLRNPQEMKRLRSDLSLIPSAVEEMLRYESPSQHTARLAPTDRELGGKQIRKRQAVIAVMAAANRDPERFPDPDRFDVTRTDNRHLAFGYAAHFCFGAPLARAEGQIALEAMMRRLHNLRLEPQSLVWRNNLGLRGLNSLRVAFGEGSGPTTPDNGNNQRHASPVVVQTRSESAELRGLAFERDLEYWRSKLDDAPALLELPTDRPRGVQRSRVVAHESIDLSPSLVSALNSLSQREDVTLFVTLLSVFKGVLSRYSGQQDLVVGSLLNTDRHAENAGDVVNPVPLRTDLSGDPAFRELLARVKKATLQASEHCETPLARVLDRVCPDRSADSWFQVLFAMPTPADSRAYEPAAHPDLDCAVIPNGDGLTVALRYGSDLFDAATIRRMLDSFRVMLDAVVTNPDQRLSMLPLLGTAEMQRILIDWNNTESAYPADQCIHDLIEAQAERTPDAVAVQHNSEMLTYREFNERANQLAHYLRKLGVGPDTPVGICLAPSLTLTVALLAVLKANGACLPLDPAYPKDRLQFMVEDSRAPILLTKKRGGFELAGPDTKRICLDESWNLIAKESRRNPETNIAPSNLAYVIYTSGSTGKPKGVMLTHGGLVNYIVSAINLYGLKPTDRFLQFSSISFDIAIEEMYPTWAAGATLVLRSGDFSLAGSDFLEWARLQKLTAVSVATAYWHELVHELSESGAALPESLRLLIVGGEKAQIPALEAWRKVAGTQVRWVNTYGPTETSVIATFYEPSFSAPLPSVLPIGRPVSNTRIYILDRNLQPVPVGVQGEIYIGGLGLARGYLNQPDLTATKFVRDPSSSDPEARLYKTGDLARYLHNGQIEFVGRRDFQIKIRGFRVEPGEIEAILGRQSCVREAVVAVLDDGLNGKRLMAYIVPVSGSTPSAAELRRSLTSQLPDYMIPSDFVFLEELPLTPNGKVDRQALLARPTNHAPAEDYAPPTDPAETKLVGIWEEVLAKRPIGTRDNFFELGGHSLLAVRLMRRIEQAFQRKLPLATLFEAPTVAQLAAIVRQDHWTPSFSLAIPIQPRGSRPPFFCVHGLGGAVLRFQDLARRMAPDQPFYGIQPQGIDGGMPFLRGVEEMASCYITEMRKVQPEGPYFIGGYSFGGLVAFEMARQLEADGQEVGLLALVDTYPGKAKSNAVLLSTLLGLTLEQQIAYVTRKINKYRKGLRRRFDALFLPKPLKEVRKILASAELAYKPKVYTGSVTWLRAGEKALRGLDNPQDDWSMWATGGVEIHEIDGDHGSIMKEPMVGVLAEKLRSCLAKAQPERPLLQQELA